MRATLLVSSLSSRTLQAVGATKIVYESIRRGIRLDDTPVQPMLCTADDGILTAQSSQPVCDLTSNPWPRSCRRRGAVRRAEMEQCRACGRRLPFRYDGLCQVFARVEIKRLARES